MSGFAPAAAPARKECRFRSSAEVTGTAALLHHDALLAEGLPSAWAVAGFLVAWQVMVAARCCPRASRS